MTNILAYNTTAQPVLMWTPNKPQFEGRLLKFLTNVRLGQLLAVTSTLAYKNSA
jgi:hypothetical protein